MVSFVSLPVDIHYDIATHLSENSSNVFRLSQTCRALRTVYFEIIEHKAMQMYCNPNCSLEFLSDYDGSGADFLLKCSTWETVSRILQEVESRCKDNNLLAQQYQKVRLYMLRRSMHIKRITYIRKFAALIPCDVWQVYLLDWISHHWEWLESFEKEATQTSARIPIHHAILNAFLAVQGATLSEAPLQLNKEFLGPFSAYYLTKAIEGRKLKTVSLLIDLGADVNNPNTKEAMIESYQVRNIRFDRASLDREHPGGRAAIVRILDYVGSRRFEYDTYHEEHYKGEFDSDSDFFPEVRYDSVKGTAATWVRVVESAIKAGADLRPLTLASMEELDQAVANGTPVWGFNSEEHNPAKSLTRLVVAPRSKARDYFLRQVRPVLAQGGASESVLDYLYNARVHVARVMEEDGALV
ncbi:hypothetical protein BJ508DRAFT_324468 [Ascobolus immersus RN42]|uniref:F-box domain-containing protein n=1 Tax=Ascobolus immersus RN42 TaxID=1160509 RepID=A0A3N4IFH5_ASCIM|nr:hypothetical protein BJ508DRAFT_324468 [Ascobolus immersus RN42]